MAFGVDGGVGRAGGGVCARCWGPYGGFGLLMAVNPMVWTLWKEHRPGAVRYLRMVRYEFLVSLISTVPGGFLGHNKAVFEHSEHSEPFH